MHEQRDIREAEELLASRAGEEPGLVLSFVWQLYDRDRLHRGEAARALRLVAERRPLAVIAYVPDLVDALDRPERLTRYEAVAALEALAAGVPEAAWLVTSAIGMALHDPVSARVRRVAIRALAAVAEAAAEGPALVWPLLEEALRVQHSEPEYPALLAGAVAVLERASAAQPRSRRRLRALAALDEHDPRASVRRLARRIRALVPAV